MLLLHAKDVLACDDPISAVDSKVGRQLFQQALLGLGVNRGKCVILATHQHQYLTECRCVLVSAGKIEFIGPYEECVKASGGHLKAHTADDTVDSFMEDEQANVETMETNNEDEVLDDIAGIKRQKEDNKEMSVQGMVSMSTYINYMRAMGGVVVGFGLIALFCLTQASRKFFYSRYCFKFSFNTIDLFEINTDFD